MAALNEQQRAQEEQMKALDTQEMNECRFSEKAPPWNTDLTNDQMGNITTWVRTLMPTNPIFGYPVEDDTILMMAETEHNYAEKM
eukprot:5476681-Heterocapsa_arctica.AAC.1